MPERIYLSGIFTVMAKTDSNHMMSSAPRVLVDLKRLELSTSRMRTERSPS